MDIIKTIEEFFGFGEESAEEKDLVKVPKKSISKKSASITKVTSAKTVKKSATPDATLSTAKAKKKIYSYEVNQNT